MRSIILVFSLLILTFELSAKKLSFESDSWDFGTIAEDGDAVTHSFTFENNSSTPVVIHNVRTSCGCTSTEYSRRPIAAGESSSIGIRFDPLNQAGAVSKSIYIYSTASGEPQILTLTGVVTPRVMSIRERYPYTIGNDGRIDMLYLTIPIVADEELSLTSARYINSSERPIEVEFRLRSESEEHMRLYYDAAVAPGREATLEVGYIVERKRKRQKSEVLRDTIDIYVNGARSDKMLYIKGVESSLF